MNRNISAIVFDLGNVLIPFDYSKMINKLDELKPALGQRFAKFYKNNYQIHRGFEKGIIPEKEFLRLMIEACEFAIDELIFCKLFSGVFTVDEKVVSLLPILKKNYKLFLLSNTNPIHREYGYKQYDFINIFDKLFLSYEVGYLKPEKEIYKAVEKYSNLPSEELIFIDDIKEYVEGAKSLGWDGIKYFNYDQLMVEFKNRNILI